MAGNISKVCKKGSMGVQGPKGDTPSIKFRINPETRELEYTSDGIVLDKEFVFSNDLVTKDDLASLGIDDSSIGKLKELKTANKSNIVAAINELFDSTMPTRSFVNIYADKWENETVTDSSGNVIGSRYGQEVNVNNAVITPTSKVDLQITSEQMVVFHEKDLAFVAENDGGVVTIYCIGSIPQNDYTIQAVVTEVVISE